MGTIKEEYNIHMMAEEAAKKVADEEIENMEDEQEVPQHVIDEAKVDAALERMRDQRQMDMYNDEMWNWSGLR